MRLDDSNSTPERVDVRLASDGDAAAWQQFVFSHADATFFHRFEWRSLINELWNHKPYFLIARRKDRVTGVLPLALVRSRLFGSSIVSLPFCVYGGPLVEDATSLAALDDRATNLAIETGVGHLEYRCQRRTHNDWATSSLYFTFRKSISSDHDVNLKAVPRKQRAMVRKGIANGLSASLEDAAAFFPIYANNVHRHGTPGMPLRWFRALEQTFGSDCNCLVVRDRAGHAVSAVMSFYFRGEAMPYYAGDLPAARELAANDFKYWQLMCMASERGCNLFDFGRSKDGTGPFAFKKNWGFEPTILPYEYQLLRRDSVPQNNPLNPKYRLMIETWRRLPLRAANWLGPHIVRGLG